MSFKRADDDTHSLNGLRKRRVSDLLREDVEEDEVSRLSNGRLVCMVCHHRPIFDTLEMFYIHRQGKKHIQNGEYKAMKKQELEDLIMKRKHEQFLKTGNTDIPQAPASVPRGLGCGKPYDPRTKNRPKPYDRKEILDVKNSHGDVQPVLQSTAEEELPGNRKNFTARDKKIKISLDTDTLSGSDRNPVQTELNRKNNNQFSSGEKQGFSKRKSQGQQVKIGNNASDDNAILHTNQIGKFIAKAGQAQDPSHFIARRKRLKLEASKVEIRHPQRNTKPDNNVEESKSTVDWQLFQKYKTAIMSGSTKSVSSKQKNTTVTSISPEGNQSQISDSKVGCQTDSLDTGNSCKSGDVIQAGSNEQSLEKKARAERELQLRGAGWKRDWTGKWVRDEDAEFDSDEETPDIP